jgi:(S)-2-hydroxyglutarate dehydrogenase
VSACDLLPCSQAPDRCDLAIVGGGILGLAVGRELTRRHPRLSVCVFERETQIAAHQSGQNSGVIHAGIYYAPGSLKARLCVQGSRELLGFCAERGIAHQRCGKLIVATEHDELAGLKELEHRGKSNGVPGLRWVGPSEITELEPHAKAIAGLYSPNTAIVSFSEVARAYASDMLARGATLVTGCEIQGVRSQAQTLLLEHTQGATCATHAIFCAGAWADRLAVAAGADPDPRIVSFSGAYLRLVSERRQLVRSLIYPVPDPSLPFLGVHLSRHIQGDVLIGPTALLALSRDYYRPGRLRLSDARDTLSWPGSWRMFARFWRAGLTEFHRGVMRSALVRAAARYVPELQLADVEPAFTGVRAQALSRNGRLIEDFAFSETERALHLRNAPSPAASCSLAIARHVLDRAEALFKLKD